MAPTPRPSPHRKQRAWVAPLVVLLVLGAIGAGVVAVVQMSDDDTSSASGKQGAKATSTLPPTTTIPRVTQVELLDQYCNAPGLKWPEVPPHVPGEPDRTYTKVMDRGVDTASNRTEGSYDPEPASSLGGSTVISPHTDGVFTDNGWVLPETRTVACVTLLGTENVGKGCDFNNVTQFGFNNGYKTMNLAQNRFAITVYELHSGGILHKGEILTPASSCSPGAVVSAGDTLAWGLTDADVLAWFSSHFVDGKPA
ncbi:MAG: hypothetical protein ACTHN0_13605 [Aquihabitans sp.]